MSDRTLLFLAIVIFVVVGWLFVLSLTDEAYIRDGIDMQNAMQAVGKGR